MDWLVFAKGAAERCFCVCKSRKSPFANRTLCVYDDVIMCYVGWVSVYVCSLVYFVFIAFTLWVFSEGVVVGSGVESRENMRDMRAILYTQLSCWFNENVFDWNENMLESLRVGRQYGRRNDTANGCLWSVDVRIYITHIYLTQHASILMIGPSLLCNFLYGVSTSIKPMESIFLYLFLFSALWHLASTNSFC